MCVVRYVSKGGTSFMDTYMYGAVIHAASIRDLALVNE